MNLTVTIDAQWVNEQCEKGVRVVRILEKWARGEAGVKLVSTRSHTLVFAMAPERRPEFSASLEVEVGRAFAVKNPAGLISYAADDGSVTTKTAPVSAGGSGLQDEGAREAAPATDKAKVTEKTVEVKKDAKPAPDPAKTLATLLESVPARDSRPIADFLRETNEVVPMLKRMDALASLWHQHLLLSIDEGYGLSEFLKALARLYEAHGLVPEGVNAKTVQELKIGVGAHDADLYCDWDNAVATAKDIARANAKNEAGRVVLCLDIGAWQAKLGTGEVKDRLRRLNAHCGSFTCVFRIPFVDSRTFSSVEESLNDVLNVRPVVVSPVSIENLTSYALASLAKRGFSFADDARAPFEQWLLDEKRDDCFFGYRTVDKMVDRVIYGKALSNCRAKTETRTVTPSDLLVRPGGGAEEIGPAAELEALVGLEEVKSKVLEIVAQVKAQHRLAKKGRRVKSPAIHMLFSGNPGTGKTTVARIVGRILRQEGVLRKGHLLEIRGRDLCGEYIGQTAPKTSAVCRDAYGSVLFIDEAYSLFRGDGNDRDYGREALDTLVAEMENHRDDLCVILAGYTDEMKTMLEGNAGLKSRIPFSVDFPNYSREDLVKIFFAMVDGNFSYEKSLEKAVREYFAAIPDEALRAKEFSNARFVRNLYERTWGKAAFRSRLDDGEIRLLVPDLAGATEEREFKQLLEKSVRKPIGFGAWMN